jgi:adenylosuccinate lyase
MVPRYSLPEMAAVWSETRKLAAWKQVEALAVEAWAQLGVAPSTAADQVHIAPVPTPEQVAERERVTDHDVAAFVDVLASSVATGGEWVHYGLTSSDVLDTAGAIILAESTDLLLGAVTELFETVRRLSLQHRQTYMVGRTHGIWAEPTSFGLKLASWAFELARGHDRLLEARRQVAVGKISGAVGTYAHTPPVIESFVCERLGLAAEAASTQVIPRDRHAHYLSALALLGASLERFATEIRHLQRSEIAEVQEPFRSGQKGSSAMPHKRNPIISERITGMARLLRGYAQVGLENVALWHERDISHSAAERVVLPDASLALYYMLVRFRALMEGLLVDSKRMQENLDATRGLVFSQAVLLALVEGGLSRDDAYRIVQDDSQTAWEQHRPLRDVLEADERVAFSATVLDGCFSTERFLARSAAVFERLSDLALDPTRTG